VLVNPRRSLWVPKNALVKRSGKDIVFTDESGKAIWNDEKVTPSQFIGSENFKSIDPFLSNKNDKTLNPSHDDMAKSAEFELTNPSYYSVFYDDINDVYVRLAYLPRTKSEYRDPLTRYKFKYSAIIMDNKFNKIDKNR